MIGNDSLSPRNAYLGELGRGFNLRVGGKIDSEANAEIVLSRQSAAEHKSSNSNTSYSNSSSIRDDSYSAASTSSKASSNIESVPS